MVTSYANQYFPCKKPRKIGVRRQKTQHLRGANSLPDKLLLNKPSHSAPNFEPHKERTLTLSQTRTDLNLRSENFKSIPVSMSRRGKYLTKTRMDPFHNQKGSSNSFRTYEEQSMENPIAQVRRVSIWDILPEDVDVTIAKHIRSSSYAEALMFATQSERQGRAMVEALNYKLVLNDANKEDMDNWLRIFGDSTRHLDISLLRAANIYLTFNNFPRLKKAEIFGTKNHYDAIQSSPRLTSLRVALTRGAVWDDLVEVCKTLPLEELYLDCRLNDYCCRRRVSVDQLLSLGKACPNVTKLDMNCSCRRSRSFWPLVKSFKSLNHLKLCRRVKDEEMDFLRTLKEVEFWEQSVPIRHILPISSNVTAVTQLRRARIDTVSALEHFPKLRKLRLAMVNGAEEALPRVVKKVEVLDLSWGYDDFYDVEGEEGDYGDGAMDFDMDVTDLYQPNPEVIEKILHSAQYLREVHFRRAIIKLDLVEKIIATIGRRLEKLSIHMDQQGERPVIRLTRILLAAAQHCTQIKHIRLLSRAMHNEATSAEKKACYNALEILKKKSPFTATHKLRRYIDKIWEVMDVG